MYISASSSAIFSELTNILLSFLSKKSFAKAEVKQRNTNIIKRQILFIILSLIPKFKLSHKPHEYGNKPHLFLFDCQRGAFFYSLNHVYFLVVL